MDEELDPEAEEYKVVFEDYKPPSRDAIYLPNYITYLVIAAAIVITVLYAIIGHLIKDLIHDLTDTLFGPDPDHTKTPIRRNSDRFGEEWMLKSNDGDGADDDARLYFERNKEIPIIRVIYEDMEPRHSRSGPRVMFGKPVDNSSVF
ncbi:small integral membrane protein 44 [Acipenser ruthenus]|uniref:small integral membrane protein 44 n=1 Tax=Acipenser ruthenus TaxID=7906 RepID=UPI0015608D04|nr:small integral membrane protein 44 [Acipenser ruthenus]